MFHAMLKFFAPLLLTSLAVWAVIGQLQAAETMQQQQQRNVECLEMLAGGLTASVTECE